jgi:hypothetical protein
MKHARSSAESEIHEAVVARLRLLLPEARIIHELNVDEGKSRVDVAAVTRNRLVFAEIKSEKDKPDRLARQLHAFGACCHTLILAAHEKWFESPGMEQRFYKARQGSSLEDYSYKRALPSPMQEMPRDDLSPKFPPILRRVLGLMFGLYAASLSSASLVANSLGVRLPSEECGRWLL